MAGGRGTRRAVRKSTGGTAHKGRGKGANADDLRGRFTLAVGSIGEDPSWLIHLRYYIEEDPLIMLTASEVNLDPLKNGLSELLGALGTAPEGDWGMYYVPSPSEPLSFILLKALLAPFDPRLHRQHKNAVRKLTTFLRSRLPTYFRQGVPHRRSGPARPFKSWEEDRIAAGYQALRSKYKERSVTPEAVWESVRPFLPLSPIEDKVRRPFDQATYMEWARVVLGAHGPGERGLQPVPADVARELWGDLPVSLRPRLEAIIRKKPREMRPYQKSRESLAVILKEINPAWNVSGSSVEQLVKRYKRTQKGLARYRAEQLRTRRAGSRV